MSTEWDIWGHRTYCSFENMWTVTVVCNEIALSVVNQGVVRGRLEA